MAGAALSRIKNPRLDNDLLSAGMVRDLAVTAEGRVTFTFLLTRADPATLVRDAHTTEDQSAWGAPPPDQVIAHTNLYWTYQTAPGRKGGTVETKDVDFGGTS